jgi:hypothetical protein
VRGEQRITGVLLNGVSRGFEHTIEALRCQQALTLEQLQEKLLGAEARKREDRREKALGHRDYDRDRDAKRLRRNLRREDVTTVGRMGT